MKKSLARIHMGAFVLAAASLFVASAANASTAEGGGPAQMGAAAAYNLGKTVFATKLACGTCPMAGKSLDAAMAKQVIANKPNVTMSADESKALDVYLMRRFKL